MTATETLDFDPALDLKLERVVPVAPELVWKAWTEPEHVVHWFTPAPWKTVSCNIDLRPGGTFRTVMESPEGEQVDNPGCFLVVEHGRLLVFTDALLAGFRPRESSFMTASVSIEPHPEGTRYTAIARHKTDTDRQTHVDMGFYDGWSAALDQLVAYVQSL
jgi:uncharacterized protein YndB with AHSA1/START domain